jgi:hypothetical protein
VEEFALGAWIFTILVGVYLFTFTTGAHRPESPARATDLPSLVLFSHPLVGLAGVVTWIAYLVSASTTLAWVAVAWLVLGATLGDVMAVRTFRGRQNETAALAVAHDPADAARAEGRMPVAAVAVHGILAIVTIAVVVASAVRAST